MHKTEFLSLFRCGADKVCTSIFVLNWNAHKKVRIKKSEKTLLSLFINLFIEIRISFFLYDEKTFSFCMFVDIFVEVD